MNLYLVVGLFNDICEATFLDIKEACINNFDFLGTLLCSKSLMLKRVHVHKFQLKKKEVKDYKSRAAFHRILILLT